VQPTTGDPASGLLELAVESQPAVAAPPWWPTGLPSPELTATILVGTLVLAAVSLVVMVRVVVPGGVRLVRVLRRIWRRVTPKSTFGKVIVLFSVLLVVVTAPTMFTLVDAKGAIENVGSGVDDNAEVEDDVVGFVDGRVAERPVVPRPSPDRDGDRLRDDWERAGETPDGAALPNASVGRKDLYLQVLYGRGIDPLDESERRELRRIWAEMPVKNPDGSTGISLHIVEERQLDRRVKTTTPEDVVRSRYDTEHLGPAECVYYQTTFGEFDGSGTSGYAVLGDYTSVVDGTETTVRTGRSARILVLTHELLHNTAGLVEWEKHTAEGWLSARDLRSNDYLSSSTAASLESGFVLYAYDEPGSCGSG
jgi:hypothetical protein